MKQIKKVVLREAIALKSEEMKYILGGSGDSGNDDDSGCTGTNQCVETNVGAVCCYTQDGEKKKGTCQQLGENVFACGSC